MAAIARMIHKLKKLNLFIDSTTIHEADAQVLQNQISATRVYISFMIISIFTLVVFTSLAPRDISVAVAKPSLVQYNDLQARYSGTLSCPCENTAIPYGSFLSITPTYHQVRLSDQISYRTIVQS